MMSSRSLVLALASVALLLGARTAPAWAQATSNNEKQKIRTKFEERDQKIKSILNSNDTYSEQQRTRLKELINDPLDFKSMATTALGPHWDTLSTDRRKKFVETFRDVVRAQSMSDLEVYNSAVTFEQISVEGDSAYVRTQTKYQGSTVPVEYILTRENAWKAKDIIVDEVSTAEGYARSFQSVMRKHGFEALMGALEKKRKETMSAEK